MTKDGKTSDTLEAFRDGEPSQRIHPTNDKGERIPMSKTKASHTAQCSRDAARWPCNGLFENALPLAYCSTRMLCLCVSGFCHHATLRPAARYCGFALARGAFCIFLFLYLRPLPSRCWPLLRSISLRSRTLFFAVRFLHSILLPCRRQRGS